MKIEESKQKYKDGVTKNGSFIATVVGQSDLKSGTGAKGDWTNRTFTLDDGNTQEKLIAWNDDVKLLKVGYKYEFNSPYWSDYKGNPQLSLGNYCQVKCIGGGETQTTMESGSSPAPANTQATQSQGREEPEGETIPNLPVQLQDFIEAETIMLIQIEDEVVKTMKHFGKDTSNPALVGMRVKEIYRKAQNVVFKRANEP